MDESPRVLFQNIVAFMQRRRLTTEPLRWDDVRLFLALCRNPTVGAAAEVLRVDSSTVSRRLVALEETLGASLFDRGRDGVAATKAAEDLMPVAEEMELAMQRFTSAAEGLEREVSGLVRITCPPDVAEVLLTPLLHELFETNPKLRIALDPGEAVLDLTRREADIALRVVRPTAGDLVVVKLADARWIPVATPALAKRLGTVKDFRAAPWVGWGDRLSAQLPAGRWLGMHVGSDATFVRSDSMRVQLAAITAGVGVGLVPAPGVSFFGLVPITIAKRLASAVDELPVDQLFLVTHRALRDVPRVRVVWDLLLARHASRA